MPVCEHRKQAVLHLNGLGARARFESKHDLDDPHPSRPGLRKRSVADSKCPEPPLADELEGEIGLLNQDPLGVSHWRAIPGEDLWNDGLTFANRRHPKNATVIIPPQADSHGHPVERLEVAGPILNPVRGV